ncbi:MAG TPA: helix-hairpin-helix domain-containing protein [Vicinamibacterales bacterium]|nr:helix-hairpin-helix domain-containing protein [Vicinamibacterales bacterium]
MVHRFVLSVAALLVAAVATCAAQAGQPRPAAQETSAGRGPALVNLNTATSAELQSLPGIGPRTAERIIEYRQKNGGFKKIEELMNIRGVGEKTFLRLKDRITVGARPERAPSPQA